MSMNIGEAAKACGMSVMMIRHYQSVLPLPEALPTESGDRQYTDEEIQTLRFIRQLLDLGFSIEPIRELLGLWLDRRRPSRQLRSLAQPYLDELGEKIKEVQAVKATLEHLVRCSLDDRPGGPFGETLGRGGTPASRSKAPAGLRSGSRHGRAA